MNRIMIFGRPGSGKSTFSLKIHKDTGIVLHHLDRYFFIEDWIERNHQEFLTIQQSIVENSQWIIDGNCIRSLEMRYSRADICIYFNYPKLLCLWRIFKRLFYKNTEINDRAEGCNERLSWKLIKYIWTFEYRVEHSIKQLREKYPNVIFIEVTNDIDLPEIKRILSLK